MERGQITAERLCRDWTGLAIALRPPHERKRDYRQAVPFFCVSGRADLNRRPHGPEPCALSKLRHAPKVILHQASAGCACCSRRQYSAAVGGSQKCAARFRELPGMFTALRDRRPRSALNAATAAEGVRLWLAVLHRSAAGSLSSSGSGFRASAARRPEALRFQPHPGQASRCCRAARCAGPAAPGARRW